MFLWRVAWDAIPAKNALNHRIPIIVDECTFCQLPGKSRTHFLLLCHCSYYLAPIYSSTIRHYLVDRIDGLKSSHWTGIAVSSPLLPQIYFAISSLRASSLYYFSR